MHSHIASLASTILESNRTPYNLLVKGKGKGEQAKNGTGTGQGRRVSQHISWSIQASIETGNYHISRKRVKDRSIVDLGRLLQNVDSAG